MVDGEKPAYMMHRPTQCRCAVSLLHNWKYHKVGSLKTI